MISKRNYFNMHGVVPIDLLLSANFKILCIAGIGFLSTRFGPVNEKTLKSISTFVIAVALPCLVLDTYADVLTLNTLKNAFGCSLAALSLHVAGIAAAFALKPFFLQKKDERSGLFISLASMQNSGYLPIPIVQAILPQEQQASGFLFVFIYVFVMGLIFWSVGIRFIAKESKGGAGETLKRAFNPPIIAMIVGLLFLIPQAKDAFVGIGPLRDAVRLLGDTTIPLVLFVLGGSFSTRPKVQPSARVLFPSLLIKLAALPFFALMLTKWLQLGTVFSIVFVLQAAMPAAMNHIVIAQEYDGDVPLISRALFIQYVAALGTVPFFLSMISY